MKTLLFDLDGTLLDTLDDLAASVNFALQHHGFPLRTKDEVRQSVGNGVRRLIQLSLPEDRKDALDETLDTFLSHYARHSQDKTRPYPGIPELLNLLKKKGYTLAIVSNKIDGAVKALQEKYFPQADLALGERAEIPRKPAPDAIFFAIQCLGAKKEDCVYVGDSEVDVLTAKNAGIPSILVTWGFRDREELQKAGATHFANSCEELSLMVERLLS